MSSQEIHILFGTESGNSERMATVAHLLAQKLSFDSVLLDMAQFEPEELKEWENVLIVISTNGEGEMPINAEAAWEEAQSLKLSGLKDLKYGILALGDTSYDYFCQAGIDWDNYLEAAGAKSINERADVDAEYYQPSVEWIVETFAKLTDKDEQDVEELLEAALADGGGVDLEEEDTYTHNNPWQAEIVEKRDLCKAESSKAVKHYSLNLKGSEISYKPGDCIEVLAVNDKPLVDKLVDVMGWQGDEMVTVEGKSINIVDALENHLEIRQPSLKLLNLISTRTTNGDFKRLLSKGDKKEIENFVYGHDVASLVEQYSREALPKTDFVSRVKAAFGKPTFYPRVEAGVFIGYLKSLQPRAYSIASSQMAFPDEVHLTIADVEYEKDGRQHKGACSMFLSDKKQQGAKVNCWLLPNKYFMLPEDGSTDIIMVGPGTGIAPFVGFLQQRKKQNAEGKNWLFFGDRESKNDFLYQEELDAFEKEGVLTRLDTAFSRDQAEKVYVQHKILEAGEEMFQWLENGAIFYICGDAKNMAKDVEAALLSIIEKHGNVDADGAKAYLKAMQKQQRYLKDVY